MRIVLMLIWVLCLDITSSAQVYQTQNGIVTMAGRFKGANVKAESNSLRMQLNYEKATLQMYLPITALVTNNDTLNSILNDLIGQGMLFNGKMDIRFVQTKSHPKQKFKVQGNLIMNSVSKPFQFSSQLEHFPRGNVTCILGGSFIINLNDFNVKTEPGESLINARFSQVVLKKPGEQ